MSEDCLTINVIRPAGLNSTAKLPVLVWIYGGSFIEGGSSVFNPVVLVGQSKLMVCWNYVTRILEDASFYNLQFPIILGRTRHIRVIQLPHQLIWVPRLH